MAGDREQLQYVQDAMLVCVAVAERAVRRGKRC